MQHMPLRSSTQWLTSRASGMETQSSCHRQYASTEGFCLGALRAAGQVLTGRLLPHRWTPELTATVAGHNLNPRTRPRVQALLTASIFGSARQCNSQLGGACSRSLERTGRQKCAQPRSSVPNYQDLRFRVPVAFIGRRVCLELAAPRLL